MLPNLEHTLAPSRGTRGQTSIADAIPTLASDRVPLLPDPYPEPTHRYCSVLKRRLIWAPPYDTLTPQGQVAAWDYYQCGRMDGLEEAAQAIELARHDGYALAEADMAALQRQAVAVARNAGEPYWVLCERRGEPERGARALSRAKERGYHV